MLSRRAVGHANRIRPLREAGAIFLRNVATSIERQAISGLKWTAASKLVSQVFAWAVTLIVVRLLAPSDYGLMAMATVVIAFSSAIAEFGLGASIIQARSLSAQELAEVGGLVILLNIGIGILVAACAPLVAFLFREPRLTLLTQVMSLQFFIAAVSAVPQALLSRGLEFRLNAHIELASALTTSLTTLLLAWSKAGVWSLVLGSLAGGVMRSALLLAMGQRVRPSFRLRGIRAHLHYGSMLTAARIGSDLILQSDMMIGSRYLPASAIGAFAVAVHVATLPMQKLMSVVNQVAFSTVARLQDDPVRLREGLMVAFRVASLVSVPLLWGLSACAPEFVRVVLGPKWEAAILPLQLMSIVVPLRMITVLTYTTVAAVGETHLYFKNMLVGAIVFPGSFLIGVQWGIDGLAVAWPIAWLLNISFNLRRVTAAIGMTVAHIVRALAVPVLAGVPMFLAISVSRPLCAGLSDPLRLPLLIVIGAATYLGVAMLLRPTTWDDLRAIVVTARR